MFPDLEKGAKMIWSESVEVYLKQHSTSTAAMYGRGLARFRDWYIERYEEEPDPVLLTDEELRQWQHHLYEGRKLAAATVNWHLSAVRGLARSCGNKLNTSDVKRVQPPIETLTARDLGRLIKAVDGNSWTDKRNVAMIAVMARAGLRVGETIGLDVEDVTLRDRSGWVKVRGKGRKERRAPLSNEARQALKDYLEVRPKSGDGALFLSRDEQSRLTSRSVQHMVSHAAQIAGLERRVTPHTLRHTFSSRYLEGGGTLAELRDILGHDNIATTDRYSHANARRMQEMVEGL
jgi:site-specific recombinase XerD